MKTKLIASLITAGVLMVPFTGNASGSNEALHEGNISITIEKGSNLVTVTNHSENYYLLDVRVKQKRALLVDMLLNDWQASEYHAIDVLPLGSETIALEDLFLKSDYHYKVEAEYFFDDIDEYIFTSDTIYYR